MTATDELRRMLTEAGVEWWPMHDVEVGYYQDRDTEFVVDGKKYTAHEWGGRLTVYGLTPAQAIAATLGPRSDSCNCTNSERTSDERGTCHMETDDSCQNWNSCSECGADYYTDQPINFCPNCGRRCVG